MRFSGDWRCVVAGEPPFPLSPFPFAFVTLHSPLRYACELWFHRLFGSQIWLGSTVFELLESRRVESGRCLLRRSAFRVGFWTELFSPCRSVYLRRCLICVVVALPRASLCSFGGVNGWAQVGFDIWTRLSSFRKNWNSYSWRCCFALFRRLGFGFKIRNPWCEVLSGSLRTSLVGNLFLCWKEAAY